MSSLRKITVMLIVISLLLLPAAANAAIPERPVDEIIAEQPIASEPVMTTEQGSQANMSTLLNRPKNTKSVEELINEDSEDGRVARNMAIIESRMEYRDPNHPNAKWHNDRIDRAKELVAMIDTERFYADRYTFRSDGSLFHSSKN